MDNKDMGDVIKDIQAVMDKHGIANYPIDYNVKTTTSFGAEAEVEVEFEVRGILKNKYNNPCTV